jgi:hypothetical protein
MEVDEMDAYADADVEAEAEVEPEAGAEILGAVAATSRNRTETSPISGWTSARWCRSQKSSYRLRMGHLRKSCNA